MGARLDYLKSCWNKGKEDAEILKEKHKEKLKKIKEKKVNESGK